MRALGELTRVELRLFAREPLTVVFVLVLPVVVLYVLNGVFGGQPADATVWEGFPAEDFYTPSYVALVAATVGALPVPVHLAGYREQGVLRRFRASALTPTVLVGAHILVAVCMATGGAVLLVTVAWLGYHPALPRSWTGVVGAFLLVAVAFGAMGTLLGLVLPTARAAQGIGVLLFFLFMMLGGAGPPREVLPSTLQVLGDALPMTYAGALMRAPWLGTDPWLGPAGVMLALLGVSLALTAWRLRSDAAG